MFMINFSAHKNTTTLSVRLDFFSFFKVLITYYISTSVPRATEYETMLHSTYIEHTNNSHHTTEKPLTRKLQL